MRQTHDYYRDLQQVVRFALEEDIGNGDISAALIAQDRIASANVICRDQAVICGQAWFDACMHQVDAELSINWQVNDGDIVKPDTRLCQISGPARSLLTAERTALNFLQTLSATATHVHTYVKELNGLQTQILDTRKTIPGLRLAQKYAVHCGGGVNHRFGLYDAVLIKENHIAAAGSIELTVKAARQLTPNSMIEVEVETLEQLQQALQAGVDRVLLDNMPAPLLRQAVEINKGRVELEASGGITLKNIRKIAETGVDFISIGALTKDIQAVDLSLRIELENL